jgi:hypothetical protein
MTMPRFTADRAAYRGTTSYATASGGAAFASDSISPAGNCGFFCNCDTGQCCEVGWGGLTCSCKLCTAETRAPSNPRFLTA